MEYARSDLFGVKLYQWIQGYCTADCVLINITSYVLEPQRKSLTGTMTDYPIGWSFEIFNISTKVSYSNLISLLLETYNLAMLLTNFLMKSLYTKHSSVVNLLHTHWANSVWIEQDLTLLTSRNNIKMKSSNLTFQKKVTDDKIK